MYLVAYGARTPLLALRGLMRIRNLALIVVPFAVLNGVAFIVGSVDPRHAQAAIALALVPAPLVAPGVVARMRGRMDLTGALVIGTVVLSVLFISGQGALAAGGLFTAVEAYALAAMFANVVPTVRDLLLVPLRVLGWGAFALVLLNAAILAPPIDLATVGVAFALFVAGVAAAAIVAFALDRDLRAAIAGAGLRDPALAVALATITAGPDSTGVALVYGVFCLVLAGIALRFP